MESKIIQDFEGEINGIKFYDQYIFNTTEYLAEEIEKKFALTFPSPSVSANFSRCL